MFYVGVDVSKDSFNFCIVEQNKSVLKQGSFPMCMEGFSSFISVISPFSPCTVVFESSGRYHIPLAIFLSTKGFSVSVVNPKTIHSFIKFFSANNPSKSDKKDAFYIAVFSASQPELISKHFSDSSLPSVKFLARELEKIKQEIATCKTQIKYCLSVLFPEAEKNFNVFSSAFLSILKVFPSSSQISQAGIEGVRNCIVKTKGRNPSFSAKDVVATARSSIGISNEGMETALVYYIEKLEFLLAQAKKIGASFVREVERFFSREVEIVSSVPGISVTLACRFIAEVGNIERFDNWKKVVKYAGTDPVVKESGKWRVECGISKQGNPHLRNVLFQMAVGVVKWCQVFRDYFNHKFSQFGSYKKAMIAVVNKLIRVLFAMISRGQSFKHPDHAPASISHS